MIAFQNPNIRVTVVDKDPHRIRKWNSKHPPIHEQGLRHILRVARDGTSVDCNQISKSAPHLPVRSSNLFFSTSIAEYISEADIIFLSVNTPTKLTGLGAGLATDLIAIEEATIKIAQVAKPGAIIVEKSTVPCGTAQRITDIVS